MADYDIAEAFRRIELLLIESMSRNLGRHQKWETDEGINWAMWQAEQVKDMRRFAQQNQKIFGPQFRQINEQVKKVLAQTAGMEGFDQENEILKALISGADMSRQPGAGLSGSFFGINDRKLGALINSTTKDLEKSENAMLRKVNDEYRKTIFNAHTYFESGASNLKQAIDMATDDFLKKGINCIEYKNGRVVNIASYSEMALRTANTRAGLIADGAKRRETGHHLVKISEYGACSETCMPWQGKVYVDDIYSGGTEKEAEETGYELLSTAVAGGLFHPNCRHRATTYYPELEDLFDDDMSDPRQIEYEHPPEERKQRQLQLDLQKEKRLAAGSLDPEKRAEHAEKAELVEKQLEKARPETEVKTDSEGWKNLRRPEKENYADVKEYQKDFVQFLDDVDKHANDHIANTTPAFKNSKEFKSWLLENGFESANVSGMDKVAMTDFKNAYEDMVHKLPESKGFIKGVELIGRPPRGYGDQVGAWYDPNDRKLYLLKKSFAEGQYVEGVRASLMNYATEWRPRGADPFKGVFHHEFGHALEHKIRIDLGESQYHFRNELAKRLYPKSGLPYISGYGSTDPGEWFAEAVSVYLNGGEIHGMDELSSLLHDHLGEALEKVAQNKPGFDTLIDDLLKNWDSISEIESQSKKEVAKILKSLGFSEGYYVCNTPKILQDLNLTKETPIIFTRDNLAYCLARHNNQLTQFDFSHIRDVLENYDLLSHGDHRYGSEDYLFFKLYTSQDGIRGVEVGILKDKSSDELIVHVNHIGRKQNRAVKKYKKVAESPDLIDKKR